MNCIKTLTIVVALLLTAVGTATAHERPPYDPDNPESYACQVDPDDPHRHPDEVCWDGHDPDDCAPEDRTDRGYCPEGPDADPEPVEDPEFEVIADPDGLTEAEASPPEEVEEAPRVLAASAPTVTTSKSTFRFTPPPMRNIR